jgi:hypothetical protein
MTYPVFLLPLKPAPGKSFAPPSILAEFSGKGFGSILKIEGDECCVKPKKWGSGW